MKYIIIILFALLSLTATAQLDSSEVNYITITGKYHAGEGVELRWFPSNRSVMAVGLEHGYVVERALAPSGAGGSMEFKVIRHVKPYDQPKWNTAVAQKNMAGVAVNLPDMADSFALAVVKRSNPSLSLDGQATDMKALKIEEENEHGALMLTAIQDEETALGLGIAMTDSSAVENKTYVYRVRIFQPLKEVVSGNEATSKLPTSLGNKAKARIDLMDVTSVETIVQTKTTSIALKGESVKLREGDGMLSIQWDESPNLAGYYLERATSPGGKYEPVNTAPILRVSGADYHGPQTVSVDDYDLKNDKQYYYRVSANTLFGEKVVVAEVSGAPKDLTPPAAPFLKQPMTKDGQLKLEWKLIENPAKDLKGFNIYQGNDPKGEFKKINKKLIPLRDRSYIVEQLDEEGDHYFKIEAVDEKGNANQSHAHYTVVLDETPPSKPVNINASIDQQGNIQIVIPSQADDDIIGYKIFKANQADHEYMVVDEYFPDAVDPSDAIAYQEKMAHSYPKENQAANTFDPELLKSYEIHLRTREGAVSAEDRMKEKYVYTEKINLNTLTPNVYYKIKTYDRNHNQSVFSDVIEIIKPDVVAPPRSVFKSLSNNSGVVELDIILAKAKDLDRVELSRRTAKSERWTTIQTFKEINEKNRLVTWRDREIEPGTSYIYRLQSVDKNGLRSPHAFSNTVRTINHRTVAEVTKVTARKSKNQAIVTWSNNQNQETYFVVYRKVNNGPLKQVGRADISRFVDKRMPQGFVQYAVKPMLKDGNKGKMSAMTTL